jgi:membrane-associated protein
LQRLFGPGFDVKDHIEKVIILVVLVSISPGIVFWLRNKFRGRTAATTGAPVSLPETISPEPQLAEAGK